jgi:hypothetical protein
MVWGGGRGVRRAAVLPSICASSDQRISRFMFLSFVVHFSVDQRILFRCSPFCSFVDRSLDLSISSFSFAGAGLVVDTHVHRVARRLRWAPDGAAPPAGGFTNRERLYSEPPPLAAEHAAHMDPARALHAVSPPAASHGVPRGRPCRGAKDVY